MSSPSLLKNIISEITYDTGSVDSILRKCLYLALKLENNSFAQWLKNEISGYTYYSEDIPNYRCRIMILKGEFRCIGSGKIEHVPLDSMRLFMNEDLHGETIKLFFPPRVIASMTGIQHAIEHGHYHQDLLGDANLAYAGKFKKDERECLRVYQDFSIGTLKAISECVKVRVLEIVLELEKKIPKIHEIIAIESMEKVDDEVKITVSNIFNNIIHGDANIANASENFNQNIQSSSDELINKLVSELVQLKEKGSDTNIIDAVIPHLEEIKHIKNQKGVMEKVGNIMTIAGGSASVLGVIGPYISALTNLFS